MYHNPATAAEGELKAELDRIQQSMAPYTAENKYKAMLYNLAPRSQLVGPLQENKWQVKQRGDEYYQVDIGLFREALSKNPDSQRLYPWQVNSCAQLSERLKSDARVIGAFNATVEQIDKKLQESDSDLSTGNLENLRRTAEGQGKLLERMCGVAKKLEKFLQLKNSLHSDSGGELKLRAKLEQLNKKLDIAQKIKQLRVPEGRIADVQVPAESLEEVWRVLRDQRNNIAALKRQVQEDLQTVSRVEQYYEERRASPSTRKGDF